MTMRRSFAVSLLGGLLLAGCASKQGVAPVSAHTTPASAQEALRPYYASLAAKLPVAPANPALADDTTLTRIASGSCVNENRAMAFRDVHAPPTPQASLLIGDNCHGQTVAERGGGDAHPAATGRTADGGGGGGQVGCWGVAGDEGGGDVPDGTLRPQDGCGGLRDGKQRRQRTESDAGEAREHSDQPGDPVTGHEPEW